MPSLQSLYTLTPTSFLSLTPCLSDSLHGLFSLKVFGTVPTSMAKFWLEISQILTQILANSSSMLMISFSAFLRCLCPNRPPLHSGTSSNPWDIKFHQIRLSYALLQWYIWVFNLAWGLRPSPLTGFRPCGIYSLQPHGFRSSHFGAY